MNTPFPQSKVSRRQTILGATALVSGTGALVHLTRPTTAQATVTTDALDVADGEYQSPTGDIYSPWLAITGSWSYQTNEPAQGWRARLFAASTGADWELLAATSGGVDAPQGAGEYELAAPLIDHSAFDEDTFDAPLGETRETQVYARVRFAALDAGDNALVEAGAADSAVVRVTNSSVEAVAGVEGSGEVLIQESQGDAPPV